ncbi:MAG TPA: Ig-like domain-containing protein, partial [Polyangiaceae bacterium]
MKQVQLGLWASAALITGAAFVACGGLNSNKVNIVDGPAAGSGGDNGAGTAGSTASGGRVSGGGQATGDSGTAGEPNADSGAAGTPMVPEAMPGAPTVVSVSPADETSDADPAKPVALHFSEPLDPASVSAASIQIKTSSGTPVPGTVSYKDAVATFTPTARFDLLATYTVSVTTAVKDVDGTALAAPFTSLFVVRDGAFGTEADLTPGADATTLNNVGARFASGDTSAIVVWSQKPAAGSSYDVVARLYREGIGWSDPTVLNTAKVDATDPVVAMNAQGDTVVAWAQADATIGQAVVARRLIAGMWDATATAIDHAVFTMKIHSITAGISPLG